MTPDFERWLLVAQDKIERLTPLAIPSLLWEARGNTFNPELKIGATAPTGHGVVDQSWSATIDTLTKHGAGARVYHLEFFTRQPGFFILGVQFADHDDGVAAAEMWSRLTNP